MRKAIMLITLVMTAMHAMSQQFIHLTDEELRIDSVSVPSYTQTTPLDGAWRDSSYVVSIVYPEFRDMTAQEAADYLRHNALKPGEMPCLHTAVSFDRKSPSLYTSFCPVVFRDGKYQVLTSFMLRREAKASSSDETETVEPAKRYAAHSVLRKGNWAKIRVPSTGVYQITESLIRQAGFSNPSKVKIYGYGGNLHSEVLTPSDLIEKDDLKEVATCDVGGKRLFYALGPVSWENNKSERRTRNYFSDYGYYFLTESDGEPLKVDSAAFVSSFYPSPYYYHDLYEKDGHAWYSGGRNLYDPTAVAVGGTYTAELAANPNARQAVLSVNVSTKTGCKVQVAFNDSIVGTISPKISNSDYDFGAEVAAIYKVKNLSNEKNIVKLTVLSAQSASSPMRLDYVSLAYDNPLPAPDLKAANIPTPQYVYRITNQDHHADPQADMVIIIPTSQKLRPQAERLKAYREQKDSLRVNIVPADELYNEFSSGTPDVSAYRRYLKMLYDRATTAADQPRYLVLFGNSVWDNRMLTPACRNLNPDDHLLVFESENSLNKVTCYMDDGFSCMLDDGEGAEPLSKDKLDVAVGRFPVNTVEEAKVMIDKMMAYEANQNGGAWQNTIMVMGDDGDSNQHMEDANRVADQIISVHPGFYVKKVMWDSYTRETTASGNSYPEVTKLVKAQQEQGALIMNYAGHGSEIQISHEKVLRINDFKSFTNTNLPLWVTASCDIMPFDGVDETIGETAVLNEKGGAVAFYGTTRTVYASQNTRLNLAFMKHVLTYEDDGRPITIGEAQRRAKNMNSDSGFAKNSLQYSLFGDPAMRLNLPTAQVAIDSIAGVDVTDGKNAHIKAGQVITVTGHIVDNDDFSGMVSLTIRDNLEKIVTRGNTASEKDYVGPFTYTDRTKKIFSGDNVVKYGRFQITFAVPKDINYSGETGLINAFAINDDRTVIANGYSENVVIGGSDIAANDSVGPSVYCYLNSPSFVNGGAVNPTPYFVAEINDKDGINVSGSGIGHDMLLIIDGKQTQTYTLNDNFSFDFGSYTSGTTYYVIPELAVGKHSLKFRVWDILNNVTTSELQFEVKKGVKPSFSVSCTDNPARDNTTFVIAHDRNGSDVSVTLEVFDMSGRLLLRRQESGASNGSLYTMNWNLDLDGGAKLQTGVYLYRVLLTADGATTTSKAKKLVVIGNK